MIAARQQIHFAGGKPLRDWDARLEYVKAGSDSALPFCVISFPIPQASDDVEESVVLRANSTSGDLKMFGLGNHFGAGIYGGKWRPGAYNDWPANSGRNEPSVTSYPQVRITVSTQEGIKTYSTTQPGEETLRGGDSKLVAWQYGAKDGYGHTMTLDPTDGIARYDFRSFGCMRNFPSSTYTDPDSIGTGTGTTTASGHRIYDYWRKINGVYTHHMIPCKKNGVVGFWEEISGRFLPSVTRYNFVGGDEIPDDGGWNIF